MMKNLIYFFSVIAFLSSCDNDGVGDKVMGHKPIYISKDEAKNVYSSEPQTIKNPGKIYLWGNYVLLNEKLRGIHIIDNSDPFNPIKKSFFNIPGNVDMAIKDNVLYVDNYSDLLAIELNDFENIKILKRLENIIPIPGQYYPDKRGYFECVDLDKGYVIDWIYNIELTDPKCKR